VGERLNDFWQIRRQWQLGKFGRWVLENEIFRDKTKGVTIGDRSSTQVRDESLLTKLQAGQVIVGR